MFGRPAHRRIHSACSGAAPRPLGWLTPLLLLALAAALAAGCGTKQPSTTTSTPGVIGEPVSTAPGTAAPAATGDSGFPVTVTDDVGVQVDITARPQRIVSTAPANTEVLFALGAGDRVVGVTSLCDYPPEVAAIPKVGDFQLNAEAAMALDPDLVVAYSGNEEAAAPLKLAGIPVIVLNPATIEQVYADIRLVALAVGEAESGETLVSAMQGRTAELQAAAAAAGTAPKVFYAVDNTLWTVGPGSFVDQLLTLAHATNIGAAGSAPYFQLSPEQLVAADPDLVLLPGSVYQSADEFAADRRFAGLRAVRENKVLIIDDLTVTRPGPRLAEGLEILIRAIHPGALAAPGTQ